MDYLRLVFSVLQDKNLVLNPPQCELAVQQINHFGHTIDKHSIKSLQDKIATILGIHKPHTLDQVNRFLCSSEWY